MKMKVRKSPDHIVEPFARLRLMPDVSVAPDEDTEGGH